MLKPLSNKFIFDFSKQYNVDPALLFAIGKKESNLNLLDRNGNLISRFEEWIYRGFKKVKDGIAAKHPSLPGLMSDWIKKHSDDELIKISTSWGIFQIMGYYYPELGYNSIYDLIQDWQIEEICVKKFLEFIVKYKGGDFIKALQNKDFQLIALMYNGLGYKKNNYDTDLHQYYVEIAKILSSVN